MDDTCTTFHTCSGLHLPFLKFPRFSCHAAVTLISEGRKDSETKEYGTMGKIRGTWDEQHMKEALEKVLTKIMSIREASQRYSLPKSSLADRLKSIRRNEEVII
ncbi:hypothetical protein JTB14_031944 [Gonioctena quinquepunctata]|nr:hypothetical protein JTB14_031944 [Gonioctena quinquepunctata]